MTASVHVPVVPSPGEVTLLQSVRSYPCVSVLLTTQPGPVLTAADATTLRGLVRDARRRLRAEGLDASPTAARLEDLVAEAVAGPATAGMALFASAESAHLVRLPVEVADRVVVDPTFATRDLVRALHRTPRHLVLLLSGTEARLLDGAGGVLRAAVGTAFPVRRVVSPREGAARDAEVLSFLRTVDRALGVVVRLRPAPLVLVGPAPLVSALRGLSRNLTRLAGVVVGNHHREAPAELARRVRPVVDAYLHSRQQEALDLVEKRRRTHRVVSGIDSAWLAARREHPEMLAVEDTLVYPARLSSDGDLLLPAEDVEHPDVLDDAVDELIELVLARGGWVALVEPGALAEHDGVALTLRRGP